MRNASATCASCPFMRESTAVSVGDGSGEPLMLCCRYPPKAFETSKGEIRNTLPATTSDNWCGEHPDLISDDPGFIGNPDGTT